MRDIAGFVRVEVAASIVSAALCGYVLFNGPEIAQAAIVAFSVLMLSCGAYGFNGITDRKEDAINGRVNMYSGSASGKVVVSMCFFSGCILSAFLGAFAFAVSILIVASAVFYSSLRLKKVTLLKNIYTAFAVSLSFLLGSLGPGLDVLSYYLAIILFIFIGSVVSDMRDMEGDSKAGIRTLPAVIGERNAKAVVYVLFMVLSLFMMYVSPVRLLPLLALLPLLCFMVWNGMPGRAHFYGGLSLPLLAAWLFILGV